MMGLQIQPLKMFISLVNLFMATLELVERPIKFYVIVNK
jgi:hypothetical protein